MSFISNASGITLREGTFNNIQGDFVNIFQAGNLASADIGSEFSRGCQTKDTDSCVRLDTPGLLQSLLEDKRRRREDSAEPVRRREDAEEDGLEVVRYKDVNLTQEMGCGPGYLLHAGRYKDRAVIVKVFNAGRNAREHLEATVVVSRGLWHPNVLRIEGTSAATSIHHLIVYEDARRKTAEGPLAAALRDDLDKSIVLGFKMISSLSLGINYLNTQDIALPLGPENFDVFLDINDRFLLSVNPPTDTNTAHPEEDDTRSVWTLFNGLCQKVLRSANRVLHDEDIERKPTVFDSSRSPAILQPSPVASQDQATLQNEEAIPNNRQNAAAVPPRREFVWRMMDLPQSLATIAAQITRDLDLRCMSIHRLVSSDGGSIHRCLGYIREEVTLAIRTADSAVVSHDAPTIQEVCSICHEVVNSGEVFRCVCRQEEPGSRPTVKCRSCKKWSHRDCGPTPNESICYFCTMQNQQYHLSEHHTTGSSIAPSTAEEDGDFTFSIEDSPPHRENEVDAASITAIQSQSVSPSRQRSTYRGGSPSPYRYRSPHPSPYDLSDGLESYRGRSKTRVERYGMQRRFPSIDPSVNGIDKNLEALSIEEAPQPEVPYPRYIHGESYMGRLIPQDFASLDGQAGYEGPSVTPQGPQTDLEEAWRVSAQVSSSLSPIPRPAAAPAELEANDIHNAGTEHAPSVTATSGGIRKARPRRKERSPYPPQHRKVDGQGQADDASGIWDGQMSLEGPATSQPIRAQVVTDATVRASTSRRKDPSKIGDFICGVCGYDFTAKHNLTNHMNSHLDIKNFKCGCGQRFGTAHVLKRHRSKCSS
ncbi:hypothetical protein FB45DRAFT_1008759 [Roridomyces roridus]|uniref:C2H2-type domain-containing protein n=1 Tax=Roridomyces roridus TaxID=1738132 RepID=A0AAD7B8C1_9AGAR|nr:hypothetical protein FB45DRAFT_1008759 [Roridomyces roridus]